MSESWEELLGIAWPRGSQSACDQSGECCRGAAQVAPWRNLLRNAAHGEETARDFLNQYVPYPSREEAERHAPDGVAASLQIARDRGDNIEEVVFYRCRFLRGKNECQVYEDRPRLCRDFPESPFGAIPRCCGYFSVKTACHDRMNAIRQELAALKQLQTELRLQQGLQANAPPEIDPP